MTVDNVAHRSRGRSSSSRRRTPSNTRARTRCPRRSSTASCCGCASGIRARGRGGDPRVAHGGRPVHALGPVTEGKTCAPRRRRSRRCARPQLRRYVVEVGEATRDPRESTSERARAPASRCCARPRRSPCCAAGTTSCRRTSRTRAARAQPPHHPRVGGELPATGRRGHDRPPPCSAPSPRTGKMTRPTRGWHAPRPGHLHRGAGPRHVGLVPRHLTFADDGRRVDLHHRRIAGPDRGPARDARAPGGRRSAPPCVLRRLGVAAPRSARRARRRRGRHDRPARAGGRGGHGTAAAGRRGAQAGSTRRVLPAGVHGDRGGPHGSGPPPTEDGRAAAPHGRAPARGARLLRGVLAVRGPPWRREPAVAHARRMGVPGDPPARAW